ncbi:MAG: response regulator [Candidatus Contendobacter sp.]|jgi:DNA-binding response OmpR family regulator|nr:response regulator [Gammaproteobacteria bacterium]MCC8993979.1 response regulator [Candidatus Contendobacter sp.]
MNQALDLRPSTSVDEPTPAAPINLILVADDEPLTRRMLARQMTNIGYQVALAETGAETLRQAATLNPNLILLDVMMPDMDGFEVCRRLRTEPRLADVPIIMIIGLDDRDSYLAGLCAGADDFMRKPIDRVELEIRLSNIMRLNRYRRLLQEKDRFARLADMAPIGIVISSLDRSVQFANSAAQALFASLPEGDGERLLPGRAAQQPVRREVVWRDPEGATHAAECRLISAEWEDQPAWLTLIHDITDRKAAEVQREALQRQLLETSRQTGMAEAATGVLHNVGNALNSVTVAAGLIADSLNQSRLPALAKALALLRDCGGPFPPEAQSGRVMNYLDALAEHLTGEQQRLLAEFRQVRERIDHIRLIVKQQQSYAFDYGAPSEPVVAAALVDDVLAMHLTGETGIGVQRDYQALPPLSCEKHKLLQILVNLIRNAQQALAAGSAPDQRLEVRIGRSPPDRLRIEITDNGIGIAPEHLSRIFEFGFTTHRDGHGFGLHASANLAREMGGTLSGHSDGPGCGATFILELPFHAPEASS